MSAQDPPAGCEWCPLCQAMARLSVARPELAERLTAVSAGLTTTMIALLRDLAGDDAPYPQSDRPQQAPQQAPQRSQVRPPVERIHIAE